MDGREAAIELIRRQAREHLKAFMQWCWDGSGPLLFGPHTNAFCEWFDRAIERFKEGKNSYCLFNAPPRHGKSDLCQFASAFFLGALSRYKPSLIYTGYGAALVQDFSPRIMEIIQSDAYRQLFPGVELDPNARANNRWRIKGSKFCTFKGLSGGITGKGGHLILVDDYCKDDVEAQSETWRERTWNAFTRVVFTRKMKPASIVVITATPWHMDDLTMRIRKKMAEKEGFPQFDQLVFPAQCEAYDALFPAMFSVKDYEEMKEMLGNVAWSAMYLCNPIGDGVRLFKDEWLNFYSTPPRVSENYIFVDTAGVEKRKNNDYLVMWVIGIAPNGNYYVLDCVRDKLNLTERTEAFIRLVRKYRPRMTWWEQIGAQSDLEHVKLELDRACEHTPMTKLDQKQPKDGRIRWLQPMFEQGRIWLPDKLVRHLADGRVVDLITQFKEDEYCVYPSVVHDDMLDCLANIRHPDVVHITGKFDKLFAGNGLATGTSMNYAEQRRKNLLEGR